MGTFNELNLSKPLLKALADIGFENPTTIQEKAYPVIMSGKDVVVIAQTGTGKTLSYLLPILRQLTYSELRHPRVLIIVPTRELVVQVVFEIEKLTVYMSLRVFGVYGASNINTQKQKVYDGLDILVATPGRLIDLTLSRTLQFSAVKKLVIDEVDEMLNLGFRSQLLKILEILPLKRQNLMFSATLNEDVELMIEKYFNVPEYVEAVTKRKGEMKNMVPKGERMIITFEIPSRGIIGLRNYLLTQTAGEAIMNHRFVEYQPYKGEISGRQNGSLISLEQGTSIPFSLNNLQERGKFFISPNENIYEGQVIGENSRAGDLCVNVTKTKKMSNMRSSGADEKVRLAPPKLFSLEECLEYIQGDEYVEVTPQNLRIRKVLLKETERKRGIKIS